MRRTVILFLVILFLMPSFGLVFGASYEFDATTEFSRIIDGDTFDTTSHGRIRLADVDAPESHEYGYYEAKDYLLSLIGGRTVYLDIDDVYTTDPYGRLVCVVYVEVNSIHYLNVNKAHHRYAGKTEPQSHSRKALRLQGKKINRKRQRIMVPTVQPVYPFRYFNEKKGKRR